MSADFSNPNANLSADAAYLVATQNSFNQGTGFPTSLECATVRKCLELGFEGNPNLSKYPSCPPGPNGNIQANQQYVEFEYFINSVLPQLISDLQAVATASAATSNARF